MTQVYCYFLNYRTCPNVFWLHSLGSVTSVVKLSTAWHVCVLCCSSTSVLRTLWHWSMHLLVPQPSYFVSTISEMIGNCPTWQWLSGVFRSVCPDAFPLRPFQPASHSPIMWTAGFMADFFDGIIARNTRSSIYGGDLDSLADVIVRDYILFWIYLHFPIVELLQLHSVRDMIAVLWSGSSSVGIHIGTQRNVGQRLFVLLCAVWCIEISTLQRNCTFKEGQRLWESQTLFRFTDTWWSPVGGTLGNGSFLVWLISGGIWKCQNIDQEF